MLGCCITLSLYQYLFPPQSMILAASRDNTLTVVAFTLTEKKKGNCFEYFFLCSCGVSFRHSVVFQNSLVKNTESCLGLPKAKQENNAGKSIFVCDIGY